MIIPFHKPYTPKNIEDILQETLSSGWLTTGPKVNEFEKLLANYIDAKYVICVNSCTAALHLALAAMGFGKGDKFIAPSYTFVASVEVGEYLSMEPILVDSNKKTFNVDLDIVESQLKKDKLIKAIIPVHFAGLPVDKIALDYLGEKYGVFILEDAAHALETFSQSRINDNKSFANAIAFSFYANKNITTGGEGGALATNDSNLSKKVRQLSLHGMSKDGWKRFKLNSKWRYDVSSLGYKYNMTDISASLGINQFSYIDDWAKLGINIQQI